MGREYCLAVAALCRTMARRNDRRILGGQDASSPIAHTILALISGKPA